MNGDDMVINKGNKPPAPPNKEDVRQQILEALKNESLDMLSLAYNYIKGFELCGDDVTKKYENIGYNMAWVKQAYSKGFQAGLEFYEQQQKEVEKRKLEIWKKEQGITKDEGDNNG